MCDNTQTIKTSSPMDELRKIINCSGIFLQLLNAQKVQHCPGIHKQPSSSDFGLTSEPYFYPLGSENEIQFDVCTQALAGVCQLPCGGAIVWSPGSRPGDAQHNLGSAGQGFIGGWGEGTKGGLLIRAQILFILGRSTHKS